MYIKLAANLTQIEILNFKANFHQEFKLFSKNKIYANNGGHLSAEENIIKFVHRGRHVNRKKEKSLKIADQLPSWGFGGRCEPPKFF